MLRPPDMLPLFVAKHMPEIIFVLCAVGLIYPVVSR